MKRSFLTLYLIISASLALQAQVSTTLVMTNPDDATDTREFSIGNYVELHFLNKKGKHVKSLEVRIKEIKEGYVKVTGIENTLSGRKIPLRMIVGFQELDQAEAQRREDIKKAASTAAIASGFFANNAKSAFELGAGIGVVEGIAKAATKVEKGEEHWHWLVSVK